MPEYPSGDVAGALAFLFVRKLCARLEEDGTLPSKEQARIWTKILDELQDDGRALAEQCRLAIGHFKLTKG